MITVPKDSAPYSTTINPDSCNCKGQVYHAPAGGCKHINALKATGAAVPASTVLDNPFSTLKRKCPVGQEDTPQ